jgi:hypothetical protein
MSFTLEDSWTKHARGLEHLTALCAECEAYLDSGPAFSAEHFHDAETNTVGVQFHVEPTPPPRLGAIVGDVAHNLRSALDVAAWQLALANDEAAARRQPNLVQFPLASTADGFTDRRVQRTLSFFSDAARSAIERLQPYQPSWEALGWLREVSNSDKHRIATFSFAGINAERASEVGVMRFSRPHLRFGTDTGQIGITGLYAIASAVEAALRDLEESDQRVGG